MTMINQGPPLHVQLARLAHSLETLHHYLSNDRYVEAGRELRAAQEQVTRLQGSV